MSASINNIIGQSNIANTPSQSSLKYFGIDVNNIDSDNQDIDINQGNNNIILLDNPNQQSADGNNNNTPTATTKALTALGLGAAAVGTVKLSQLIASSLQRSELKPEELDFIKLLSLDKPMTSEEALKLRERAIKLFEKYSGPEGLERLKEIPIIKWVHDRYHPNKELNGANFVKALRNYILLRCNQIINYQYQSIRSDNDGTLEFKDFANIVNGADQAIDDRIAIAYVYWRGLESKSRGMLNLYLEDKARPSPELLAERAIKLLDAGVYTSNRLTKSQVKDYLTIWARNEFKTHKMPTKAEIESRILQNLLALNTARIGGQSTDSKNTLSHNPVWGAGNDDDPTVEVANFAAGPDSLGGANNYTSPVIYNMNVYGMTGPVLQNGELIIHDNVFELEDAGLYDLLIEGKYAKAIKDALARVKEHKGLLTQSTKSVRYEYYDWKLRTGNYKYDYDFLQQFSQFKDNPKITRTPNVESLFAYEQIIKKGKGPDGKTLPKMDHAMQTWGYVYAYERKFLIDMISAYQIALLNKEEGKNPDFGWEWLEKRVRPLEERDFQLMAKPRLKAMTTDQGDTVYILDPERLKAIKKETHKVINDDDFRVPISQEYYDKIKSGSGLESLKEFIIKAREANPLVITVHTLTNELQRVFSNEGMIQDYEKDGEILFQTLDTKKLKNSDLFSRLEKREYLETGKYIILSRLLELEKNPKMQELLKSKGLDCVLRVDMGPLQLNIGKKSLFTVVNNSKEMAIGDYIGDKAVKELAGQKKIPLAFAAYVEQTLVELQKAGTFEPILHFAENHQMAGDSVGSDMRAVCTSIVERINSVGISARGMIKRAAIFNTVFDVLDIDHKDNKNRFKKAETYVRISAHDASQGTMNEMIAEAKNKVYEQLTSQTLRYQYVGSYDKNGKKLNDKANNYEIIGAEADKLVENNSLSSLKFKDAESLRQALDPFLEDILVNKWMKVDDVHHHHYFRYITEALLHGKIDVTEEVVRNFKLAGKGLDSLGLYDRKAYWGGMPSNAIMTPKDWQSKLRKGKNVFHPLHRLWLQTLPAYLTGAHAGGLLTLLSGLLVGGLAIRQELHRNPETGLIEDPSSPEDNNTDINNPLDFIANPQASSTNSYSPNNINSRQFNSVAVAGISAPHNTDAQDEFLANIALDVNAGDPAQQAPKAPSKLMSLGLTGLDVGIFLSNASSFLQAVFMTAYPQPLAVLGSTLNMGNLLFPEQWKLPMFIVGTTLNMGGWALAQSQSDVAVVDSPAPEKKALETIADNKYNSYKDMPHAYATKEKDGKKEGYFHRLYPGAIAATDRAQFFKDYKSLLDKKIPSFVASSMAGIKQLATMNWKMISAPLTYGRDMLEFIPRQEFTRSTRINMPNVRSYMLALGSFVPMAILGGTGVYKLAKNTLTSTSSTKPLNNTQGNNKPTGTPDFLTSLMPNNNNDDNDTTDSNDKPIPEDLKRYAGSMELASNMASIVPSIALLTYAPVIKKAGFGTPFNIVPPGIEKQHLITPRLNGNLIQSGSIISIGLAGVSALSTAGILPLGLSAILDPLFIGVQGVVSTATMRNTFETNFAPNQSAHFFPKLDPIGMAESIVEARLKKWLRPWGSRAPSQNMYDSSGKRVKYR